MSAQHTVEIQQRWFDAIVRGDKNVEGKKGSPKWAEIKQGDSLMFVSPTQEKFYATVIADPRRYSSVADYLINEGLRHTLPGVTTLQDGIDVYLKPRGFWEPEEVGQYGIIAFELGPAQ